MTLREQITHAATWEAGYHEGMEAFGLNVARLTLDAVEARAHYADRSSDPVQAIVNELRAQLTVSPAADKAWRL